VSLSSCLGLGLDLRMGSWLLNCALSCTVLIKLYAYVGDRNAYWRAQVGTYRWLHFTVYTLHLLIYFFYFLQVEATAQVQLWEQVASNKQFLLLHVLFLKNFSVSATSAPSPDERVFSSSGLLMRLHRARMDDQLRSLVFLTCIQ